MMASQTIKEKIEELQKSKETPQNSRPKIQRVAYYRRKIPNLRKYYKPKLVSIGPIHHDNKNLKLGEKYKLMWAAEYIENTPLNAENTALNAENFALKAEKLYKKIADDINNLKGHFSEDVLTLTKKSLEGFGTLEEKLSLMLFVDGCSLLHILENARRNNPGKMNIKVDQLFLVMVDVVLLENQLPYEVLKLLWKNENESELIQSMTDFFKYNHWAQSEKEKDMGPKKNGEGEYSVSIPLPNESPTHLLDHLRKLNLTTPKSKLNQGPGFESSLGHAAVLKLLGRACRPFGSHNVREISLRSCARRIPGLHQKSNEAKSKECSQKKNESKPITYRGIEDLRAVGISLKASFTPKPTDIDFSAGWFSAKLTIPRIPVNNFTAAIFLNLVAYEMCPDFDNDYQICSYVALMDSLIDHPEDVKVLRSKRILSTLWSDEEVANLFNIIGTDLVANIDKYFYVQDKLCEHYFNKYKSWIALGFRTYFNNPWTVIAFLVAFTALALTFIQTWFTVHPASK